MATYKKIKIMHQSQKHNWICIGGHLQTTFTRRGRLMVQKCPLFDNVTLYHRKYQRRGIGGQKKT